MPTATSHDGTRIHYETYGDRGPWVLLIQGLGLSSRFWFTVPSSLVDDPTSPSRVIVVDNRGVGRSDRPRGLYRTATLADDLVAVLDAVGAARVTAVGISLGGMIAQQLALRHPSRVEGLVLLATSSGLPHATTPALRAMLSLAALPFAREKGKVSRSLLRLLIPARELSRAEELFADWPAALAAEPTDARSFFAQLAAAVRHSTGRQLGRLACPVVVVTGSEDVLIPAENSRFLARAIPGAKLEVVDGVGHAIPVLDPEVVGRSLARVRAMRSGGD